MIAVFVSAGVLESKLREFLFCGWCPIIPFSIPIRKIRMLYGCLAYFGPGDVGLSCTNTGPDR